MSTTGNRQTTRDEAEIRELIERWSKAIRDEDLEAIRAGHDPGILMFDVPQPLQARGVDAYMETWKKFFAWSTRPVVFDLRDVEVTASSEVAFATAIGRCSGTERNGRTIGLEFRLTMGFQKRNDTWQIVHEHHSLPADD